MFVAAEWPGPVRAETGNEKVARCIELTPFVRELGRSSARACTLSSADEALGKAAPSLEGPPDKRKIELVGEQALRFQACPPFLVELSAEWVRKAAFDSGFRSAPYDVMAQREARSTHRLQHCVAERLSIIDFRRLGSLEQKSVERENLHEAPVAKKKRIFVNLRSIWKMIACPLLPRPVVLLFAQAR
jgi:hypothetical protein